MNQGRKKKEKRERVRLRLAFLSLGTTHTHTLFDPSLLFFFLSFRHTLDKERGGEGRGGGAGGAAVETNQLNSFPPSCRP